MTSFKSLVVSAILIGIFVFGLISFGANIAKDNDAESVLSQSPNLNKTYVSVSGNLTQARSDSETQRESLFKNVPEKSEIGIFFTGIVGVAQTFYGTVRNIYSLTIGLTAEILGVHPTYLAAFTTLIVVLAILAIWRLYRTGT